MALSGVKVFWPWGTSGPGPRQPLGIWRCLAAPAPLARSCHVRAEDSEAKGVLGWGQAREAARGRCP